MRFLIAGFGSIGRRHYRNLKSLGESDFVFLRSKLGTIPGDEISAYVVETDLQAALEHDPDVVIVSNPTSLHLDVAIPAAARGCHLFLEKPISHNMDGIGNLEETVTRSGVKVLVGFQFRYHPQLILIKELLIGRDIGDIISVRVQWGEYLPDWHPWEDYRKGYSARKDLGGGVVLTLCHPLDYLHWIFGEVDSIWSYTQKIDALEIDVEAVAEIGILFQSGVIGSLHLDYIQHPPTHQMEIIGSQGKIRWDYYQGSLEIFHVASKDPEIYPLPEGFERNRMFRDQMIHFLDILYNGGEVQCGLREGIITQELIQGVKKSAETKNIYQL